MANRQTQAAEANTANAQESNKPKPKCGIIMPIADNVDLGYASGHWSQVRDIIIQAAEAAGFESDMVSNDSQVDVIHATIIKNIYANDVAVCDVSSRNPNVMFELGLRIASKKPVIIIKDETTPFAFDTQIIPHLLYRRDLRLYETLDFQKKLQQEIAANYRASQETGYKSFLEQFTSYTLAQVNEREVEAPEYIIRITDQIQELQKTVTNLNSTVRLGATAIDGNSRPTFSLQTLSAIESYIEDYLKERNLTQYSHDLFDSYRFNIANQILSERPKGARGLDASQVRQIVDNYINHRKTY